MSRMQDFAPFFIRAENISIHCTLGSSHIFLNVTFNVKCLESIVFVFKEKLLISIKITNYNVNKLSIYPQKLIPTKINEKQ
jgi:hypothetical protein